MVFEVGIDVPRVAALGLIDEGLQQIAAGAAAARDSRPSCLLIMLVMQPVWGSTLMRMNSFSMPSALALRSVVAMAGLGTGTTCSTLYPMAGTDLASTRTFTVWLPRPAEIDGRWQRGAARVAHHHSRGGKGICTLITANPCGSRKAD